MRLCAEEDQLLAEVHLLFVRMDLSLLYLHQLVGLLLFSLLKLTLRLVLLVLLLSSLSLFLNRLAFSLAFLLLSPVLPVALLSLHKLLLRLLEPSDIANQSLLQFVLNHLCVVLLLGLVLSLLDRLDLLPDFVLLVRDLLELLCIGLLGILDLLLFALDFVDALLDAFNHLLDLRQRLRLFLLSLSQQADFVLQLLLLLDQRLRIFDHFDLSDDLALLLRGQRVRFDALGQDLAAFVEVV